MEYHYLYQIISLVPDENGVCKIYSGVRKSKKPPEIDEYFGSGYRLKAAVKKHGRDKFIKTIVATFPTREEAYACETQWLEKLFHKFYGGDWSKFNRYHYNLRLNENSNDGGSFSVNTLQKMRDAKRGGTLTPEHKQKIGAAATGEKGNSFQGLSVGTHQSTGRTIVFDGNVSMKQRGFHPGDICRCISGGRKHANNFTFTRTTDEDYLRHLLAEDNFHDEQSKQVIQNFLQ